ncbi:MAG: STAS domain-containing protein [Tenuifilaceae bacterium]|jgi:anti-anti-sigma regulatory factor|nr:STAS domain-containing protein [Tenuifilaceae bacterium]
MAKAQNITLKAQASKGNPEEMVVTIQGELTLDNAQKIKDFLLATLAKGSKFLVKISNVDSIDLGFIQLLQRFKWDAQQVQKDVELSAKLTDDQSQLLTRAGFASIITLKN